MNTVTSPDGTPIGYDRTGTGEPLVLVGGTFSYRRYPGQVKLAEMLSARFTVYSYDRRGRGDSGDSGPYSIDREIEDLAAVIAAAGGHAYVWGLSSGAVLALDAAAAGVPMLRLAAQEPPLVVDPGDRRPPADLLQHVTELIGAWLLRRGGPLLHDRRHGRALLRSRAAAADARGVEAADRRRAYPAL